MEKDAGSILLSDDNTKIHAVGFFKSLQWSGAESEHVELNVDGDETAMKSPFSIMSCVHVIKRWSNRENMLKLIHSYKYQVSYSLSDNI